MTGTPDRVSNGGPDRAEQPMDWRDHCTQAVDSARDAIRMYRDDRTAERNLRLAHIDDAIESLRAARALLEAK